LENIQQRGALLYGEVMLTKYYYSNQINDYVMGKKHITREKELTKTKLQ
jgi:hypothetical protein